MAAILTTATACKPQKFHAARPGVRRSALAGPAAARRRSGAGRRFRGPAAARAESGASSSTPAAAKQEIDQPEQPQQAGIQENGNGSQPGKEGEERKEQAPLPETELEYAEPSGGAKFATRAKLAFALPWRRFKDESVLTITLSGQVAEQLQGRFSSTVSLPAVCECLKKAALDPRIVGVVFKIEPLACGWGKLQELRRHVEFFKQSGKFSMAYMERGGEKEYYIASCFGELYIPPTASLSLRGLSVSGTFLREALDKIGVQPEVRRIGKFKSAGDQLLRTDMSDAQREQLTALLDDIYGGWLEGVAQARGKTKEEVEAFLDEGMYDMSVFKERGMVDDLKYECEIEEILKERTGGKEDELRKVGYKKYRKVSPTAFGLSNGRKAVAVVRTSGAITGTSFGNGSSITSGDVIRQLRALKKDKNVAAVVLRVDSPGGDALASDLMWREIQELCKKKPVVASMADVAASGGYYMAMACSKIVAEALTITGSIGVVTGKFNLQELYKRIGYGKQNISRGKYAQLLAENKAFDSEEEALFDAAADHAYRSFRDKAAASRGMSVEAMQEVAQGRVWSGQRAVGLGLVDHVGGLSRAIQLAKREAGLEDKDGVRVMEVSYAQTSPLQLLGGGASAASSPAAIGLLLLQSLAAGSAWQGVAAMQGAAGAPALLQALAAAAAFGGAGGSGGAGGPVAAAASAALTLDGLSSGRALAAMPDVSVEGVASQALAGGSAASGGGSGLFDE